MKPAAPPTPALPPGGTPDGSVEGGVVDAAVAATGDTPATAGDTPAAAGDSAVDVSGLRHALAAVLPGCGVESVANCVSTSTVLLARVRDGGAHALPAPVLRVAGRQSHGRGRQGRAWFARPGASLTFSLALPLAPADWGGLSLAVGVALADALEPAPAAAGPRLCLKWPNDLWLVGDGAGRRDAPGSDDASPGDGRKLGGVLIETAGAAAPRWCVVGVGLNIAPQPLDGAVLAHGYACCRELDPDATAASVLMRVAVPLAQALRRFERQGFGAFHGAWRRRDLLQGRAVVAAPGTAAEAVGTADGVDDDGALRLRAADGRVRRVVAGEIGVRLRAGGAVAPAPDAVGGLPAASVDAAAPRR